MAVLSDELVPPDEDERLAAVRRYDILDTPPDGAFDRVTALAARFCNVPISTITIVDEDRIWFKSAHGIDAVQIGRDPGLCASAILRDAPHVVTDAATDPRTLDNPLVRGELGLRFYVGVPLITADGHRLGTLNVIDVHPRELSPEEIDALRDLAAIVVDELELRLMARRQVELEAARENARFRDSVLAGLSHELRTPLAMLQGLSRLEGHDVDGFDQERRQELLRRQVRHLDWLVQQFLDFASLEGERQPRVRLGAVGLDEVAAEVVDMFVERAAIAMEATPGLEPAYADRDRTLQILAEFVNNAVCSSPPGSPILVRVGPARDGEVRVTVADEGPGIEPQAHDLLFEKFYRGAGSTGSGVGLYVAKALAEAQNGRIEIDSAPGEGSRFTLVVPTASDSTERRQEREPR